MRLYRAACTCMHAHAAAAARQPWVPQLHAPAGLSKSREGYRFPIALFTQICIHHWMMMTRTACLPACACVCRHMLMPGCLGAWVQRERAGEAGRALRRALPAPRGGVRAAGRRAHAGADGGGVHRVQRGAARAAESQALRRAGACACACLLQFAMLTTCWQVVQKRAALGVCAYFCFLTFRCIHMWPCRRVWRVP